MAEMGKEKVTMMKLKVDLECSKCYKKVKKVLCKFPQIRDTIFDEKSNTVIIKVVCCSPEKIMDKLCCKGGGSIKTIEIIEPPKPPPQAQPQPKPKVVEKPKEIEKPKQIEKPKEQDKPKEVEKPKVVEKPKEVEKPKDVEKPPAPKPAPAPAPTPAPKQPSGPPQPQPQPQPQPVMPVMPQGQPVAMCCGPCYEGYGGGPCFNGYGMPAQPYECYGRPVYESWGGGPPPYRTCHVTRCDYFSEDNPQTCSIM